MLRFLDLFRIWSELLINSLELYLLVYRLVNFDLCMGAPVAEQEIWQE